MSFYGMRYILVVIDYVLKWVEVVTLLDNQGRSVTTFFKRNILVEVSPPFLRDIFSQFGTP